MPDVTGLLEGVGDRFVVVHPGMSVPARLLTPEHAGLVVGHSGPAHLAKVGSTGTNNAL